MKKIIMSLLLLTVFIFSGCGGGGSTDGNSDLGGDSSSQVSNEGDQPLSVPENVRVTPAGISRKAASATPFNTANEITWDPVDGALYYNIYWLNDTPVTTDTGNLISDVTSPYIHSGLDSTLTYYYIVTAIDGSGESPASDEVSANPIPQPENVTAETGNTSIRIRWDEVTGATSYNIYWLNAADVTTGTGTQISVAAATGRHSYTHENLTNNTTYYYIVTAIDPAGEGSASAEVSAIPAAERLSPPTNISATPGNTTNTISWDELHGAESYNLYWLNSMGVTAGNGNVINIALGDLGDPTNPEYTHSGLTNGLAYYYIVTAVDENGVGAASTEATATPVDPIPTVPGNATATAGDTSNEITWDAVAGATAYNIYYNTTGDVAIAENPLAGVTTASPYTHTHAPLANFTDDYYYIVTAVNADGESSASAEVSATPVTIPTNVNLTPNHSNNVITWDRVTGATSYKIYWLNADGVTTETGNIINTTPADPDNPQYTHSNLTSGLNYYYIVTAVGLTIEGPASAQVFSMPISPPANVTATAGNLENVITWDAVAGATAYNIYSNTTGNVTTGETPLTGVTATSPYTHTHTPLTNGDKYFYIVTANNGTEESLASSEVSATPVAATVPANVTATAGDLENEITWDAVAGATAYNIYWLNTEGVTKGTGNAINIPQVDLDPPPTSHTHAPLLNDGTEYFYVITAVVATVNGDESAEVSAIPATPPTAPAAPATISVTAGNTCNIITWDDTVPTATSYNIYWHTTSPVTTGTGNKITDVTTPYTHPDRANETEYFYIVTAVNDTVEGVASEEKSATPVARPAIPLNVSATAGDTQNEITWDVVAGATSYNIYWLNKTGVTELNGTQVADVARPYTHTPLTNGDKYFYIVTAVNDAGESAASSEVSATPDILPDTPTITTVVAGNGINVITWAATANTTSYNIYWLNASGVTTETGNIITIPEEGANPVAYTHAGLTNDITYFYIVTAVNGERESTASEEMSGTPAVPSPGIPANVTATPGDAKVLLIWDAVTDATSYNIYWSDSPNVVTTGVPQITGIETNSHSHTGLFNDTTYYYKISATIGTIEGSASGEISATPSIPIPTKPVNVTATPGNTNNTIIWDESDGATFYNIYWGTQTGVTPTKIGSIATPYIHEEVSLGVNLTPGTEYFYIVTAENSSGESSASDEVSAIVLFPRPVTDTGQTNCYNNLAELIPCPAAGEAFYGQDANYSISPQTYTKLDSDGNVLPINATSWAMVRDSGTGLIWEVKTDDDGTQDKDLAYTWAAANTFIESLNTGSFGRFTDWRLPTVKELKSIVDYSKSAPSINDVYFLNTLSSKDAYYWSSTEYAINTDTDEDLDEDTDHAWFVHFVNGYTNLSKKTMEHNVRAVRGGP